MWIIFQPTFWWIFSFFNGFPWLPLNLWLPPFASARARSRQKEKQVFSKWNYFNSRVFSPCLNCWLTTFLSWDHYPPPPTNNKSPCCVLCLRPFVAAGPQWWEALRSSEPVGGLRRRRPDLRPGDRAGAAGADKVGQRTSHRRQHGEPVSLRTTCYSMASCLWWCNVYKKA